MKAKLTMLTIAALATVVALQAQTAGPPAARDEKVTAWCPAMIGITFDDRVWRHGQHAEQLRIFCDATAEKVLAEMPDAAGRVDSGITPLHPFASEEHVQKLREMGASQVVMSASGSRSPGFNYGPQFLAEMTVILSKGGRAEAEQVVRETARRVQTLADEMTENYRKWFASAQEAADLKLRRAEARFVEATQRSAAGFPLKDGLLILNAQTLAMQVMDLQSQGQQTLLLLEGKKARLDAVQRQIAIIGREAEKKAEDDPVAKELREILRLQERALEAAVKHAKQGVVSEAEIDQQKINTARARAELAQRIEDSREKFQGGVLPKLNEELATLAIDVAELEAKLKQTRSLLPQMQEAQVHFSLRDRQTNLELGFAEKALQEAYRQREGLLDRAGGVSQPRVTAWVLDKPAGAEAPGTWRKLPAPDTQPAK